MTYLSTYGIVLCLGNDDTSKHLKYLQLLNQYTMFQPCLSQWPYFVHVLMPYLKGSSVVILNDPF